MNNINNPDALADWMRDAPIGASVCYFEGLLMRSRALHDTRSHIPSTLLTAQRAWGYHLMGRLALVQKRIGDERYQYLAQKVV